MPLARVLLLGWDIGAIMLLSWAKSAIVGVFNLLKLAVIGRWTVLFYGPFFVGHYGAFMAVHLLWVYTLFLRDPHASAATPRPKSATLSSACGPPCSALASAALCHSSRIFSAAAQISGSPCSNRWRRLINVLSSCI